MIDIGPLPGYSWAMRDADDPNAPLEGVVLHPAFEHWILTGNILSGTDWKDVERWQQNLKDKWLVKL